MKNKELAKNILYAYLTNGGDFTADGLLVMYEIGNGNDELLLTHVKALRDIFNEAIKEIENERTSS